MRRRLRQTCGSRNESAALRQVRPARQIRPGRASGAAGTRWQAARGALALAALAGALACGSGEDPGAAPGSSAGQAPTAKTPRGVVMVVVDTLRADHLGSYGYEKQDISPRIDALAQDAVRFDVALAPSPWTLPSLATIMTGLYPGLHGAKRPSDLNNLEWLFKPHEYEPTSALHESRTTLAEVLRDEGFATAGFVQGSYPSSAFGVSQGFDRYQQNATPGIRFDIESAFRWLDEEKPERFFLYLHTLEVHSPYAPIRIQPAFDKRNPNAPLEYFERAVSEEQRRFEELDRDPDYDGEIDGSVRTLQRLARSRARINRRDMKHLIALYDRGISYTDYWIGQLIDGLSERGLYDESVFVLTADHGEEFREHGGLEHNYTFYEEMLRVPLVVRVPGEGRGTVVPPPVGLVDVMPTLLDVLELEPAPISQGRSLRPLWLGESLPEQAYFGEASLIPGRAALRTARFKYVRDRRNREELYDLSDDPEERENRCPPEANDRCAPFREQLKLWEARSRQAASKLALPKPEHAVVDDALLEKLRELGYIEQE